MIPDSCADHVSCFDALRLNETCSKYLVHNKRGSGNKSFIILSIVSNPGLRYDLYSSDPTSSYPGHRGGPQLHQRQPPQHRGLIWQKQPSIQICRPVDGRLASGKREGGQCRAIGSRRACAKDVPQRHQFLSKHRTGNRSPDVLDPYDPGNKQSLLDQSARCLISHT